MFVTELQYHITAASLRGKLGQSPIHPIQFHIIFRIIRYELQCLFIKASLFPTTTGWESSYVEGIKCIPPPAHTGWIGVN